MGYTYITPGLKFTLRLDTCNEAMSDTSSIRTREYALLSMLKVFQKLEKVTVYNFTYPM